jgi:hypothetical protein
MVSLSHKTYDIRSRFFIGPTFQGHSGGQNAKFVSRVARFITISPRMFMFGMEIPVGHVHLLTEIQDCMTYFSGVK